MRALFFTSFFMLFSLTGYAQSNSAFDESLCLAAVEESAFGSLVDELIENGSLAQTSGESLLSTQCANGQSVLSRMVMHRQSENLEYAVIDLGLSLSESHVLLAGQKMPLRNALELLAEQGDTQVRAFVQESLLDLDDEDFNPNLRVSLK